MIAAIEQIPGINSMSIEDNTTSKIEESTFVLSREDYEAVRLSFQRIAGNYQAQSLQDRTLLAHNSLPARILPNEFPERERPYVPGTVYKLLGGATGPSLILRGKDRKGIVNAIAANARSIADRDPLEFAQLQKDLEKVTLAKMIDAFKAKIDAGHSEQVWQRLFNQNPFILSMVFGYPVVLVAPSSPMGGFTAEGSGMKIADFLFKHEPTNNAAIVEIKKPNAELFWEEYRTNVWSPHKEIAGAIVQVLDQKNKLLTRAKTQSGY